MLLGDQSRAIHAPFLVITSQNFKIKKLKSNFIDGFLFIFCLFFVCFKSLDLRHVILINCIYIINTMYYGVVI